MAGGQVNVLTKAGTNAVRGSVFEFHRNDALDAKNYFDVGEQPPFSRNQFGGTLGGPVRQDKLFYFIGYEGLRENLGRTITSSVPDENARLGLLPDSANPGQFLNIGVTAQVAPSSTTTRCRTGRIWATGPRPTTFSSIRHWTRISSRAAWTTTSRQGPSSLPGTP